MKAITRTFLLLISLSLFATPALAQDEPLKADWVMPPAPKNVSSQGIVFMEPTLYPNSTSYLTSYGSDPMNEKRSEHICKTVNTETCATEKSLSYNAYIPVCDNAESQNCIEDFWLVFNGSKLRPKLDSYMPTFSPLHFKEDFAANLPEGKSSSIWRINDPQLGQSDLLFSVSAVFSSNMSSAQRRFGKPNISVVIDPVEKVSGNYSIPEASKNATGWSVGGCLQEGCGTNNIGFCAAIDLNLCAKRINNIEGIRYGVKIRISDPPITWVHGRLLNAEFTTLSAISGATWSIEAEPTTLPVTSGWISNADYLEKMNIKLPRPEETSWTGPLSSGTQAITDFNKWLPFMGEKAQALQKRWSVGSIYSGQTFNGKYLEECVKPNAIAGVVMSNATVYQGEPPSWNSRDFTLDYKVAAPHLTPTGKEFKGNYQLRINSDFARCIYGLKNVPLTATVSVIGSEGASKIATSSISMRDDWINFNVSGFTFSTPTIKVQLAEAKNEPIVEAKNEVAPTNSVTSAVSQPQKKSSITCIKGKVTKKVTAVKPKCPAGYKKK